MCSCVVNKTWRRFSWREKSTAEHAMLLFLLFFPLAFSVAGIATNADTG